MILMAKFDDGGRRGNNVDATATAISVSITCAVSYYKLNKNTAGKTVASMMIVVLAVEIADKARDQLHCFIKKNILPGVQSEQKLPSHSNRHNLEEKNTCLNTQGMPRFASFKGIF